MCQAHREPVDPITIAPKPCRLPQFSDCIETLANDRDAVKDFFPIWNFFLFCCSAKLFPCTHSVYSIHSRRSATHVDCRPQGLHKLRPGGSELDQCFRVKAYESVTSGRDCNAQGPEFLGLFVQRSGLGFPLRQGGKALHCIGNIFAQKAHMAADAARDFGIGFTHEICPPVP